MDIKLNIEKELLNLKSDFENKINSILEITNNIQIDNINKREGYFSEIPCIIFESDIISRLSNYPIIDIIKYIYDNTNRLGSCGFTLSHMIISCGYKVNRHKGFSNDKFNLAMCELQKEGVIEGYVSCKPNDFNIIKLVNSGSNIRLYISDYKSILTYVEMECSGISKNKLLLLYSFLTYCNSKSIIVNYEYIENSLGISDVTITTALNVFKKIGLDKYILSSYSNSEGIIANILTENNIEFISEKRFEECSNVKKLPFDFYIPSKNLIIEYDGQHHFFPVKFGGISDEKANELFVKTQTNDIIKNKFCNDNNIKLVRIPYTKKNDIKDIVLELIK